MLDDSPFTPSVDVFERSPAEAPLDLFAQDFATSPGPSPFLGILPPSHDADRESVTVSPGELHEFPLTPDLLDRSADESGGETLQRPDSPVDALLSGDYMFGVYL